MLQITKAKALSTFRELWRDQVSYHRELRGDAVAKREAFNNFIDAVAKREAFNNFIDDLHRQRYITDHQVFNWTNPF
jgi:hypothetical protein